MVKFALLTTEGSPAAFRVLAQMKTLGHVPHMICVLKPNAKKNFKRVVRKLYSAGPTATVKRIVQILRNRRQQQDDSAQATDTYQNYAENVVYTRSFTAPDFLEALKAEQFDVFVALTDEILVRKIFALPKHGTLNAHPGHTPTYRGLSALARMIRDGVPPVISVHLIDEGIDTGPLIARIPMEGPVVVDGDINDALVSAYQAAGYGMALDMVAAQGRFTFIDTFLEESNMARALNAAEIHAVLTKVAA